MKKSFSIAPKKMGDYSLLLGMLALICCLTGKAMLLSLLLSIPGYLLGNKARKALPARQNAIATAGWICSIIAFCCYSLFFLFMLAFDLFLMAFTP